MIVEGDEAHALLRRNALFRAAWQALATACPWATAFQEPVFSDAWWDTYDAVYTPIVLHQPADDGALRGLLVLARHRDSGVVVPVGAHHAEYHAWLARPDNDHTFIRQAIGQLRNVSGVRRVRFHFLAPNAPTEWTRRLNKPIAPLVLLATHPRGLRDLGDGSADREALRRKSARSKLSRLRRAGEVSYRAIESRAEFEEWLPQIIAQSNARHGNSSQPGPFAADPRKAAFYLRLFETPGFAHCGVLVRGAELLASHTGWIDRGALGLGLLTFNAAEAEHSPGSLLLHYVGDDMASRGVHTFDLTPGGSYKQRLATRADAVHTLDVRLTHGDAIAGYFSRLARVLARASLVRVRGWRQLVARR
jgi:CelD/BcsL family acetyltransferase involved in cellulose biosynthesis